MTFRALQNAFSCVKCSRPLTHLATWKVTSKRKWSCVCTLLLGGHATALSMAYVFLLLCLQDHIVLVCDNCMEYNQSKPAERCLHLNDPAACQYGHCGAAKHVQKALFYDAAEKLKKWAVKKINAASKQFVVWCNLNVPKIGVSPGVDAPSGYNPIVPSAEDLQIPNPLYHTIPPHAATTTAAQPGGAKPRGPMTHATQTIPPRARSYAPMPSYAPRKKSRPSRHRIRVTANAPTTATAIDPRRFYPANTGPPAPASTSAPAQYPTMTQYPTLGGQHAFHLITLKKAEIAGFRSQMSNARASQSHVVYKSKQMAPKS